MKLIDNHIEKLGDDLKENLNENMERINQNIRRLNEGIKTSYYLYRRR